MSRVSLPFWMGMYFVPFEVTKSSNVGWAWHLKNKVKVIRSIKWSRTHLMKNSRWLKRYFQRLQKWAFQHVHICVYLYVCIRITWSNIYNVSYQSVFGWACILYHLRWKSYRIWPKLKKSLIRVCRSKPFSMYNLIQYIKCKKINLIRY